MAKATYELTFWGFTAIKYKRCHTTYDAAVAEARRVLGKMSNRGAHPAIIYGPDLGKDGRTVS